MPINCALKLRNLTQPEFDERDAIVMRCAYAAQNALGRLCDERVYENELARRLRANGFSSVHTQVPVRVTHEGFAREYRLDLVADDALYELKTVSEFVPEHDAQALHYAKLLGVNHAKLLNFRPGKVHGRLRFNVLLADKRRSVCWEEEAWRALSPQCDGLKRHLASLLDDWGAGLEVRLYETALIHFCGGETRCLRRVPIFLDGCELGTHALQSHAEGLFFIVTAFNSDLDAQQSHIRRLLALTRLRGVQWINFNHTTVQLTTIQAG
jgi:GxxExxY protein